MVCIPVYLIFTFISHLHKRDINPVANWLSDYGNPFLNPSGALLYNMGCIIVAVLLAVFYAGMFKWYMNRKIARKYVICYVCAQISGIAASVFLVLASLVPLGVNDGLHGVFSTLNMIGMDSFLSFTALAFFLNPDMKKWIGVMGYLSAVFNVITMNAFSSLYIAEWIYFLLFMAYMAIIFYNYENIVKNEGIPAGPKPGHGREAAL